jgi:hypothetical protein
MLYRNHEQVEPKPMRLPWMRAAYPFVLGSRIQVAS